MRTPRPPPAALAGQGYFNGEALFWSDGLAEWKPLRELPELAAALGVDVSAPPAAAAAPAVAAAPAGPEDAMLAGFLAEVKNEVAELDAHDGEVRCARGGQVAWRSACWPAASLPWAPAACRHPLAAPSPPTLQPLP